MTTFKSGDIVICKKYEVSQKLVIDKNGMRTENYINDSWFNREAVILETSRECMLRHGFENPENKDEYYIRFVDDNNTLAWVSADDLVLKVPMNNVINLIFGKEQKA